MVNLSERTQVCDSLCEIDFYVAYLCFVDEDNSKRYKDFFQVYQLVSSELVFVWIELGWVGLNLESWKANGWFELRGWGWVELGLVGLGWVGLAWVEGQAHG